MTAATEDRKIAKTKIRSLRWQRRSIMSDASPIPLQRRKTMALLELKQLKKYFDTQAGKLHAVDDINLSIEKGTTLGVVGESGCGKTTLGKTVVRLTDPTSGEIWFNGDEISHLSKQQFRQNRTELQMIFQDPLSSLDPRMSVSQLIAEPLVIYKRIKDKTDRQKRVRELMDTVGIASIYEHSYPHELDGGRRQRIGTARALSLDPQFIVCDEPVSALDVSIQAQILNLLRDLQTEKNLTYMFITHNLAVVRHVSDLICVMYLGRIVEQAKAKDLFARTLHPYTQALMSAIPVPDPRRKKNRVLLKGELASPINPKPCCRFAPRCLYADDECFAAEPVLKDAGESHLVACFKA